MRIERAGLGFGRITQGSYTPQFPKGLRTFMFDTIPDLSVLLCRKVPNDTPAVKNYGSREPT